VPSEELAASLQTQQQQVARQEAQLASLRQQLSQGGGASLVVLQGQESTLKSVLRKEQAQLNALQERQLILSSDKLSDYYYVWQVQFNDALLACKTIHSKLVRNSKSTALDKTAEAVKVAMKAVPVPGLSLLGEVIARGVEMWTAIEKEKATSNGANFLPGAASIETVGELLARQLCLAQAKEIEQIPPGPKTGFIRHNLHKLKTRLSANDIDTAIKDRANKECRLLLEAIMKGTVATPNLDLLPESIAPLFQAVMGPAASYRSPVTSVPSASPTKASPPPPVQVVAPMANAWSSALPGVGAVSMEELLRKMVALEAENKERAAREQAHAEELAQLKAREHARAEQEKARVAKEKELHQKVARMEKLVEGLEDAGAGEGGGQAQVLSPSTARSRGAQVDITDLTTAVRDFGQLVEVHERRMNAIQDRVEDLSDGQQVVVPGPKPNPARDKLLDVSEQLFGRKNNE
jgi:hypothetical protein